MGGIVDNWTGTVLMKETTRLLHKITLRNLLSFGPESLTVGLENLNILIGPNGSGKSNFIDAISLLRGTPISDSGSDRGLAGVWRLGGGSDEWIWKGGTSRDSIATAEIDVFVDGYLGDFPLRHFLALGEAWSNTWIRSEQIEMKFRGAQHQAEMGFEYLFRDGTAVMRKGANDEQTIIDDKLARGVSILGRIRDAQQYPVLETLAGAYEGIRIYREWEFGRESGLRRPQSAAMRNDRLEEDFSNLGLVLSRLQKAPAAKAAILDGLKTLYEGVSDFGVSVEGGTVQVFFTEGNITVPATRLSDGTLRYLCLLTILCDPDPPPLICIEEPELGLHPDVLPDLSKLLVAASQRTQLIVTTHSDILVDTMTERPESVIICEKHDGRTSMRRLVKDELADWLKDYRLGELWSRGHLGGNRW